MTICAVIRTQDNLVINTIVADPTDLAPNDCYLVEMTDANWGGPGWTWDGTQFIPPADPGGV